MPGSWDLSGTLVGQSLMTVVFVLAVLLARALFVRRIRGKATGDARRRWLVLSRNAAFLFIVLGLTVIWSNQLRGMAISIMAVVVAVVIACKELLMCLSGSMLRVTSGAFDIGDRIEVSGFRGDVIDHSLLNTRLLEIGPGPNSHQATGRILTVPNSVFLSATICNESLVQRHVLHTFSVPFKRTEDFKGAEQRLLDAAREESRQYIEEARRELIELGEKEGIDTPSAEPRVTLHFPDAEKVELMLRLAVPSRRKGVVQQAILRRAFLD